MTTRRIKLPLPIIIIAVGFILVPLVSTYGNAWFLNVSVKRIVNNYETAAWVLMGMSPLVGLAITRITRWSWYLFITYSLLLLAYNISLVVRRPDFYTWSMVVQSILLLGVVAYFLNKDLRMPYFAEGERGFRRGRRNASAKKVYIGDLILTTVNISRKGMLLEWPGCPNGIGQTFSFRLYEHGAERLGRVVRVDGEKVGVAFED